MQSVPQALLVRPEPRELLEQQALCRDRKDLKEPLAHRALRAIPAPWDQQEQPGQSARKDPRETLALRARKALRVIQVPLAQPERQVRSGHKVRLALPAQLARSGPWDRKA